MKEQTPYYGSDAMRELACRVGVEIIWFLDDLVKYPEWTPALQQELDQVCRFYDRQQETMQEHKTCFN